MDAFEVRRQLVADYAGYIHGFIHIRDQKIREHVENGLASGLLWPDPLIQLNPAFESGDSIDELVEARILHDECANVFQKDKQPGPNNAGKALRLYKHQSDAIRVAVGGQNYVLTTGTASGKSLAYIVPIVNHVLRRGSRLGIQAIIVYPMNALANSQAWRTQEVPLLRLPRGQGPSARSRSTRARRRTSSAERSSLIRRTSSLPTT